MLGDAGFIIIRRIPALCLQEVLTAFHEISAFERARTPPLNISHMPSLGEHQPLIRGNCGGVQARGPLRNPFDCLGEHDDYCRGVKNYQYHGRMFLTWL